MANSAHVYRAKSGKYNVSFHHPICRDGSIGKKIHRGLKVSTESEAAELKRQIDELLSIADTPSLIPTRSTADQHYAPAIVGAFYDCMTPEPVDYLALRERLLPLPERQAAPRVLVTGATGVGKSRFIQHLLQTTRLNFPMRGAGRTTVSDTEVIVADTDFSAAITIFSQNEIRQIVRENVLEACAFAQSDSDKAKIGSKLMVDSDKRFRFNFILGDWTVSDEEFEDDDLDAEEEELSLQTKASSNELRWPEIETCVDRIMSLARDAAELAERETNAAEVKSDDWLPEPDPESVDALVEQIVDELERRLCAATGASSWPATHQIGGTPDKLEFFAQLQPFYQNNRKLFGSLVTPLVQGIRIQGRLFSPALTADNLSSWVLLDGQGVGHERVQATTLDRTIPPELAKKFSSADVICLVDRAVPAMTGDAPILLEHLLTRGYLDRLLLVFTNFEAVDAPDLDAHGRRMKVLEGLSNAIQSITLPKAQRVLLERNADDQSYFLSNLNLPDIKTKSTKTAIQAICARIGQGFANNQVKNVRPLYNEYEIAKIVNDAIVEYRSDWSESSLSNVNYKIVEALANWIGNAYSDGYPRRGLYPGQNLSERLVSGISLHLDHPRDWEPTPPTEDEQSIILNAIRSRVSDRVDSYCRQVVVHDPRTNQWLPAYQNIYGPGTLRRRARTVARILEDHAQLPDEGVGKFTKDIWQIVEDAIAEVCAPEDAPD